MPQTHLPEAWIERTAAICRIPMTHEILRFFTAWQKSEGGNARWNPLNVTNHVHSTAHGDWQQEQDYNPIGVCNFNKAFEGIMATSDTLLQDVFSTLVVSLRQAKADGTKAEELVVDNATAIKTWGTNPTTMLDVLKTVS
jgi:hypothetical protein